MTRTTRPGAAPIPVEVYRFDIETGRQTPWMSITPPDTTGVPSLQALQLSSDGKAYTYSYVQFASDLYLVEGLR